MRGKFPALDAQGFVAEVMQSEEHCDVVFVVRGSLSSELKENQKPRAPLGKLRPRARECVWV